MAMTETAPERARKVEHLTVADRSALGKAARAKVSRSQHGEWAPVADRPDPVALMEAQETTRLPELLPLRHSRMAASPFAFYRGAANVLAADLATVPHSGLRVQLCGDAHLANFGGFASPERSLVFDLNDFDETLPGPFEWDVKRLAASIEVAARELDIGRKARTRIVTDSVRSYRDAMHDFARMQNLDVWYSRITIEDLRARLSDLGGDALKRFQHKVDKAQSKDRLRAESKLTEIVDGEPRFVSDPPLLVPIEDLFSESLVQELESTIHNALRAYRRTLPDDRRHLVESYRFVQLARKVVGVGSVGTRCWVALMVGLDNTDPLFIQIKEAEASVLEPYLGKSGFANHGQRVVNGQRLVQAASDIFLGWERVAAGEDGKPHDHYFRQLWDWKASADIETTTPAWLDAYGQLCGWTLARAHARSGDRVAIAAYLGRSDTFDQAIARFASIYAEQNDLDHRALTTAIATGRMSTETEP
jgi:uncharacterized protein (DUF2252 family)